MSLIKKDEKKKGAGATTVPSTGTAVSGASQGGSTKSNTKKITVQEMTTMALLAALLCVSSYISIRLPISTVPITAQTLVINMIALLLLPKKAGLTVLIWILLGAVGLPVFSNGTAGFGILAGATGGYIFGYLAAAILISLIRGKKNKWLRNLIAVLIGIPMIYAVGLPWMKAITGITWQAALVSGMAIFLPGDIVKCVLAVLLCKPLWPVVNAAREN